MDPPAVTTVTNPTTVSDLPSVYVQPETATTGQLEDNGAIFDCNYMQGLDGILKISEMVLSLITFICSVVDYTPFTQNGGGWVQFVAITAFILTGIDYLIHCFKMTPKLTSSIPLKFTEFCFYACYTVFFFIAGIIAACNGYLSGAVVATAVFSFFCLLAYGFDAVFIFMEWRQSTEGPYFSSTASAT